MAGRFCVSSFLTFVASRTVLNKKKRCSHNRLWAQAQAQPGPFLLGFETEGGVRNEADNCFCTEVIITYLMPSEYNRR